MYRGGLVSVEAMLRGIPVVTSNIGGLPEVKLGVDYCIPVKLGKRIGKVYRFSKQDLATWASAFESLTSSTEVYQQCSQRPEMLRLNTSVVLMTV